MQVQAQSPVQFGAKWAVTPKSAQQMESLKTMLTKDAEQNGYPLETVVFPVPIPVRTPQGMQISQRPALGVLTDEDAEEYKQTVVPQEGAFKKVMELAQKKGKAIMEKLAELEKQVLEVVQKFQEENLPEVQAQMAEKREAAEELLGEKEEAIKAFWEQFVDGREPSEADLDAVGQLARDYEQVQIDLQAEADALQEDFTKRMDEVKKPLMDEFNALEDTLPRFAQPPAMTGLVKSLSEDYFLDDTALESLFAQGKFDPQTGEVAEDAKSQLPRLSDLAKQAAAAQAAAAGE